MYLKPRKAIASLVAGSFSCKRNSTYSKERDVGFWCTRRLYVHLWAWWGKLQWRISHWEHFSEGKNGLPSWVPGWRKATARQAVRTVASPVQPCALCEQAQWLPCCFSITDWKPTDTRTAIPKVEGGTTYLHAIPFHMRLTSKAACLPAHPHPPREPTGHLYKRYCFNWKGLAIFFSWNLSVRWSVRFKRFTWTHTHVNIYKTASVAAQRTPRMNPESLNTRHMSWCNG